MNIILYDDRYRDDMLAMISEARVALGLPPSVRADLYDVKANYLDKGDGFWLALDEDGRVIGCLGWSRTEQRDEAFLHRFYVKADRKRRGIGTRLLLTAEAAMREGGIRISRVHLGGPREQWYESYAFYPKNGYTEVAPRYMQKRL